MVFFEPEQGIPKQKVTNLVSSVVEDQSTPVLVLTLARVRMLVQMCSIKVSQPVAIFREMSGNPIQNHAYSISMTVVDEIGELLWLSVPGGRSIVANGLITPTSTIRMFRYRQKFDVGIAHLLYILDKLMRELAISEVPVSLFW